MKQLIAFLLITWSIPSIAQNVTWREANYSVGFGRTGFFENPRNESSVFNPYLEFDLSYCQFLYQRLGVKTSLTYTNHWINTRNDFIQSNGSTVAIAQSNDRHNVYLRNNRLALGIGPQFLLFNSFNKFTFINFGYSIAYSFNNKFQYTLENDDKTYAIDLEKIVNPFRHRLYLELNVLSPRKMAEANSHILRLLTVRANMDLNGYADKGVYRQFDVGFLFGF